MRSRGWDPGDGISELIRREGTGEMSPSLCPLLPLHMERPCEDRVRRQCLESRRGTFSRHLPCWHFDLGLSSLRDREKTHVCCLSFPAYDIL